MQIREEFFLCFHGFNYLNITNAVKLSYNLIFLSNEILLTQIHIYKFLLKHRE